MTDTPALRTAIVTGASSGIGEAFAERLARDGYDVIIVARRRDRLEALAKRLGEQTGRRIDVLASDLTDPEGLQAAERAIEEQALDLLVNCAGFGGYMPFVELPPDRAEELIRLHIVAITRLTRAALPAMIARGVGAIVNVSSLLAFSASLPSPPMPQRAVYAGAKSYINTFTEILANELAGSGVQAQVLCPGLVQTEFHDVRGLNSSGLPPAMAPEDVVQASLAGLRLGEVTCIPALEDTSSLARLAEDRSRLVQVARTTEIASRYRDA
ncbi:MAG: SDR family oxidoreductase [Chloroflexota bacterium]|nr:SDR family oxidoreductase [Chloroflexota bacterium]